jgi:hypothetical protein
MTAYFRYRRIAACAPATAKRQQLPQSGHRLSRDADSSVDEEQSFVPRHCWLRRATIRYIDGCTFGLAATSKHGSLSVV